MLPNDNYMLLSYVNMKLRDQYHDIEDFCYDEEIEKQKLDERLNSIGYFYNNLTNQYQSK